MVHRIGAIKTCRSCGINSYIRQLSPCPECGAHQQKHNIDRKDLNTIIRTGIKQRNSETVEKLYKDNLIDDFTRWDYE